MCDRCPGKPCADFDSQNPDAYGNAGTDSDIAPSTYGLRRSRKNIADFVGSSLTPTKRRDGESCPSVSQRISTSEACPSSTPGVQAGKESFTNTLPVSSASPSHIYVNEPRQRACPLARPKLMHATTES